MASKRCLLHRDGVLIYVSIQHRKLIFRTIVLNSGIGQDLLRVTIRFIGAMIAPMFLQKKCYWAP